MLALKKIQDSVKKHTGSKKDNKLKDKQPTYQQDEIVIPVPWGHVAGVVWHTRKDSTGTVICVHNLQDNAGSFETLIPLLPDNNKYICIDLPGHGKSSHFPHCFPMDIYKFVMALRVIANSLKLNRFSLMGHSYSSLIVGLYSAVYPESIDKVIKLDIVAIPVITTDKTTQHIRKTIDTYERFVIKKPEENYYQNYEDALKNFIKKRKNLLSKKSAGILISRSLTLTPEGFKLTTDPRMIFSNLPVPTLTYDQVKNILSNTTKSKILILSKSTQNAMLTKSGKENFESMLSHYHSLEAKIFYVEGNQNVHLEHPEKISEILSPIL